MPSTSGLQRVEVTRQKISDLYRHLGVPNNDPNLANLERFRLISNTKGILVLEFLKNNGDWVNLTDKRTGEFLADATLKQRLGGESGMTQSLGLEDTPERFKKQKQAAMKLNDMLPTDLEMEEIPLKDLSRRISDVTSEIRRESADGSIIEYLPMREILGLDKALQRINGEMKNNVAKLAEIDKQIVKERDKLKEMENDPIYTDEQRQEVE